MKTDSLRICKIWQGLVRIVCFAGLVVASDCPGDDWPHWMGPGTDGIWNEIGTIDQFPETGPKVLWRQQIGSGYAGPSVVGEQLFIMDRTTLEDRAGDKVENNIKQIGKIVGGERVRCLNTKTGEEVWSHEYECDYKIAYPTGPRCTPAVAGDQVFTLGAMGRLICFDKATGDVVWEKELTSEYETKPPVWGYASHPFVKGDMLLVPVGGKGSGVVAFNRNTGEEIWRAVTTTDICYAPLVMYEPDGAERQSIFWHADGITSFESGNRRGLLVHPISRGAKSVANRDRHADARRQSIIDQRVLQRLVVAGDRF